MTDKVVTDGLAWIWETYDQEGHSRTASYAKAALDRIAFLEKTLGEMLVENRTLRNDCHRYKEACCVVGNAVLCGETSAKSLHKLLMKTNRHYANLHKREEK